jgi:ribosomal protein L11 methyltransferase
LAEYPALEIAFGSDEDPDLLNRLYAVLDDFEPMAIQDDDLNHSWRVFFRTRASRDAAVATLRGQHGLSASAIDVPDEDWARRSQESLRAVHAGALVVAPPWDIPKGVPVIIIEPSTGFGTGHHATTRLCLLLMQRLDLRGARVLDVGTGSGVLALAAWKLGASEVTAVDVDADALDNARSNIARNGAAPAIDVIQDDLGSLRIERADVVLANLTGAVLVRYGAELQSLVLDGGYLILSGFAPDDLPIIDRAFARTTPIHEQTEGEWAAVCLRR